MNLPQHVSDWILEVAQIPSFSSYEERIHPFLQAVANVCGASFKIVNTRNVVLTIEGTKEGAPIALAAHLDKINHFNKHTTDRIPVSKNETKLIGLLDDATGVGLLLYVMSIASTFPHPPLLLLFSEMEESTGLKKTPQLMRNNGKRLRPGIGAVKLSQYLYKMNVIPQLFITIDTTPLFHGEPGIALYSRHWELNQIQPSDELLKKTTKLEKRVMKLLPSVQHYNNTNDYLEYGKQFSEHSIPSIALEPSIYPYHCANEEVFIKDVEQLTKLVVELLKSLTKQPLE